MQIDTDKLVQKVRQLEKGMHTPVSPESGVQHLGCVDGVDYQLVATRNPDVFLLCWHDDVALTKASEYVEGMVGVKKCKLCDEPPTTELDGDMLCKTHADTWVRAEGQFHQEAQDQ